MKRQVAVAAFAAAAAAFTGCRTTNRVLHDYERDLTVGSYSAAADDVKEFATGDSPWYNCFMPWRWETFGAAGSDPTSLTMWQLLYGGALYMDAKQADALDQFDKADDSFARNDQASVFAQGAATGYALMSNDRVLTYDGGGQDRIFTCLYKAIDYASLGKPAAARTELNRAADYQEQWLDRRRADVAAARTRMEADAAAAEKDKGGAVANRSAAVDKAMADPTFGALLKEKTDFDPATSGNLETLSAKDYMNVYVQHVCGVFRWLNGDGGKTYLRDAASLRPDHPTLAADAREARAGKKPKNQVWIYVEDGLCPAREEVRLDLPTILLPVAGEYVMYVGFALPKLRERCNGAINYTVRCGGQSVAMEELADVDKLVKTEFDVYMRGAIAREVTRVIVKAGAQAALGAAAHNSSDWRVQTSLRVSQAAVAAWAAGTTAADLRSWTALPKKVRMARVTRPANGVVEVLADGQIVQIQVPEGNTMVFVRKPGPSAVPMTKTITMK